MIGRLRHHGTLVAVALSVFACNKSSDDSRSGDGGGAKSGATTAAGSLAIVTGEILPAEGADASTVSGALVQAEGRPDIAAVTDADGKFSIENVVPGTVAIYVGSNDGGAALTEGQAIGPSEYGLKITDVVLKSGTVADLGQQALKKTGGLSGKVLFYSNPNDLDLTGSEVFVPGTSFIAKTDASGAFALTGLPPGKYDLRAQHTGFAVLDVKDVEVLEGQTVDIGNLTLSLSTGPEGSIKVVEDLTASIAGNASAKIVKSRSVKITFRYDSDAALMKVADEPSFTNVDWVPVKGDLDWTFKSDGLKSLYVMYSDLNGLESSPYKDEVFVDTLPPTLTSIKVLHGWASSAGQVNPVDLLAADGGSGVAQFQYRIGDGSFSDTWAAFAPTVDVDIGATAGVKLVRIRVRDYAGNVSEVASDEITKADATEIYGGEAYDSDVRLRAAQSPFEVNTNVVFNRALIIEPGVTLTLNDADIMNAATVTVNGPFIAEGTATNGITIEYYKDDMCRGAIDLKKAAPGVKSSIKHVHMLRVGLIEASGGTISDSLFDSRGCSSRSGEIRKYGKDLLTLTSNEFKNWAIGIEVRDGTNATSIGGSRGDVKTLVRQSSPAAGTSLSGNQLAIENSMTEGGLEIYNGHLTIGTGNDFSGNGNIIAASGTTTVSGIKVSGCRSVVGGGTVTVTQSDISGCRYATAIGSGTVTFTKNDMQFNTALIFADEHHDLDTTFYRNNITLSRSATNGYADLFVMSGAFGTPTINATMTQNNITCNDGAGCRGGIVATRSSGASGPNGDINVTFSGNHWTHLAPTGLVAGALCNGPLICADADGYNGTDPDRIKDGNAIKFYEFIDGHVGGPPASAMLDEEQWAISGDFLTNGPAVAAAGAD